MREIYYPTKTEKDIYEILRNFQSMTQKQLETLFGRHGYTEENIDRALHNLWVHGKIFHERDGRLWKANQHANQNMDTIGCIDLMLTCTEGAEDEIDSYKTALFGAGDYTIAFVSDGILYYIVYMLNSAAAVSMRLFQEKLNSQGDLDSRNYVRLVLVAPDEKIFDKVAEPDYPAMYVVMNRYGYQTEFKMI